MMNRKTRLYIRFFVLCALITFAISAVIMSINKGVQKKVEKFASKLPDNMSMTGLTINQYHNGKKLYTLRIGKYRICRKKIGFVKIGFLKIAMINDVKMDIFLSNVDDGKDSSLNNVDKGDDFAIFRYLETNPELETMIRRHQIKGIEIEGIKINFYRGEKIVCSVSSKSARIDYKNNGFIFKGDTTITADNRILKSHRISWQNKDKKFFVNGRYKLFNEDGVKRGECLKADFLLREIEYCDDKQINEA